MATAEYLARPGRGCRFSGQMAQSGAKVMQFLRVGHYVANVVDGKVSVYSEGTERTDE